MKQLDHSSKVMQAIFSELKRAEELYPGWPDDIIHAAAVVGEEAGELTKACLHFRYQNGNLEECWKEAVQTAAMAIRFLLNMEAP